MTQHEKNWAYVHKLHLLTSYHFITPYVQTTLFYFQLLAIYVTKFQLYCDKNAKIWSLKYYSKICVHASPMLGHTGILGKKNWKHNGFNPTDYRSKAEKLTCLISSKAQELKSSLVLSCLVLSCLAYLVLSCHEIT